MADAPLGRAGVPPGLQPGIQPILATNLTACASEASGFAAAIPASENAVALPSVVLADTGFASGAAVANVCDFRCAKNLCNLA